jgi:hypothetical protein
MVVSLQVHLRGMPYDCGENEVDQFFAPLKVTSVQVCVSVVIKFERIE